ncbi:MAG TPA: sensor domain-containing phosphodiesterase [Acidimicrobiales bacterium]|nr:sensor domain-containing phosphodiesterase [Acidimicrobiales bacterium]
MRDAEAISGELAESANFEPMAALRTLLGRLDQIVIASDAEGNIRFVNDVVADRLGYAPDAIVGRNLADFVTRDHRPHVAEAMARWNGRRGRPRGSAVDLVASDGTVHQYHYRAQFGDGVFAAGDFVVTLSPADPLGHDDDIVPALIDNADRVARVAAAFLDKSFGNFGVGLDVAVRELAGLEWLTRITVWTMQDGHLDLLTRWDAAYGAPVAPPPDRLRIDDSPMLGHLVAGNEIRIASTRSDDLAFAAEGRAFASAGTESLVAVPLVARDDVLGAIILESTFTAITNDVAHLATTRAAAAVIAAAMIRHEAEAELAFQARTDRTTGLSNRWAAQSDLDEALDALGRNWIGGVGVIGVDLDRFKLVNEALGHRSGDLLLTEVADRFRSAMPTATQLARLSADEFLIVVQGSVSESATMKLANTVLDLFAVPFEIGGSITSVTARAGVVHFDARHRSLPSAEEVLRRVAHTVDHAKHSGRRLETVDLIDDGPQRRLRRVGELERALVGGELVPYFQAEWDLVTGDVVGAEALLRWLHPDEGLVGASEPIRLAESTGLIGRIGRHVLMEACRAARPWTELVDGFVLRVNVSAQQLRSDDFVTEVAEILDETGFAAASLCLELTESSLLDDPERSRVQFARLRDLGVGLAIDDFGTGYSSILQLKELPLSSIKIDQRFVAGVADNPSDRAIVEAILELARAFGMSVTAEGVEVPRQRDVLERLGCTRVQGFLFSTPEPAADFAARLARLRASPGR